MSGAQFDLQWLSGCIGSYLRAIYLQSSQTAANMCHPAAADPEKEWMEKLFDECEDEFYESFGVYDGKFKTCSLMLTFILIFSSNYTAAFVSQRMIFFPLMMMKKILGTGLIVSEESILIKSMQKLNDWRHHLLGGKRGRVNKRENRKSRATRSSMKGCRGNTKSI